MKQNRYTRVGSQIIEDQISNRKIPVSLLALVSDRPFQLELYDFNICYDTEAVSSCI